MRTPRRRGEPVTSQRKHRGILKEGDDLFKEKRSRAFTYLVLTGSKRRARLFENGTANTFVNECEHAVVGLGRFELPISRPPAERSRPN